MEIPLNAQVECTDGLCGHSVYVLINPISDQVTHLVVEKDELPNPQYIVPVDVVTETIAGTIRLRCSKMELEKMDPFINTTFIQEQVPVLGFGYGNGMYGIGAYYQPYVIPEQATRESANYQHIPPGELAVHRGTRVEAKDGDDVGHVDEFVVDPVSGHITHLVLREGHLWGKKDVIIPLSAIGETRKDTVFLRLDKHQIEDSANFPYTQALVLIDGL